MTNQEEVQNKELPIFKNIEDVLQEVKKRTRSYASHIWIPSLDKEFRFEDINTSQQKRLVKSIVDSPIYNTEFIYTFYDILKENCVDDVDIDSLTVIDKMFIAICLRANSIGNIVQIQMQTEDEKSVDVNIDLDKVQTLAKKSLSTVKSCIISDRIFEITCSVPTIKTEFLVEEEFRGKNSNFDLETPAQFRETIGEAFIDEIAKYVADVKFKDEKGNIVDINWKESNFTDRIKVVGTFDMVILKKIINYINDVRKEIDKIELVSFTFKGKKHKERLTIDGSFFTVS